MSLAGRQGSSITGFIGHAVVIDKSDKTAVLHRCGMVFPKYLISKKSALIGKLKTAQSFLFVVSSQDQVLSTFALYKTYAKIALCHFNHLCYVFPESIISVLLQF